jgi:hypothetical protein
MVGKIPFKYRARPVDIYELDDRNVRVSLGIETFINPTRPPKRADKYVRYSDGKFGILETKSSTLRKAPAQLESTADLFLKARKQVDYLIVVLENLSSYEREHLYEIRNGILCKASDGKPIPIVNGSYHWQIEVFQEQQVNTMWDAQNKLFGGS